MGGGTLKRYAFVFTVLVCLAVVQSAPAQVVNAALSGTVSDGTGVLIPGVEITATNVGTGVVTMAISNESGTYRNINSGALGEIDSKTGSRTILRQRTTALQFFV